MRPKPGPADLNTERERTRALREKFERFYNIDPESKSILGRIYDERDPEEIRRMNNRLEEIGGIDDLIERW